jgi:hypothetical protein
LGAYLKEHRLTIPAQLLEGSYKPRPLRRVEIPKSSGGMRPLGNPTLLVRFIQQAIDEGTAADWDGVGFRLGRSADLRHGARHDGSFAGLANGNIPASLMRGNRLLLCRVEPDGSGH